MTETEEENEEQDAVDDEKDDNGNGNSIKRKYYSILSSRPLCKEGAFRNTPKTERNNISNEPKNLMHAHAADINSKGESYSCMYM